MSDATVTPLLDNTGLMWLAVAGAALVLTGVVGANTMEQMGAKSTQAAADRGGRRRGRSARRKPTGAAMAPGMMIFMPLFVAGWVATVGAHALPAGPAAPKTWLCAGGAAAIIVAVAMFKMSPYTGAAGSIFLVGWAVFAYGASLPDAPAPGAEDDPAALWTPQVPEALALSLSGAAAVIAGMFTLAGWQRKHEIVDGPGMVLFTLGWVLVVMVRALPVMSPTA
jgi:hypothetical protein